MAERITGELLEELLAAATPEAYLAADDAVVDRTLPDYLFEVLREKGVKRADVARNSGINGTVVYDIFSGKSRPGRDHAIMLAFGLQCNLRQTQRLLRLASVSELWCKVRRDAILIWCIEHGLTREEADDELYRLGEKTLLGTDRLA
jgi:DNA-binding phage protein